MYELKKIRKVFTCKFWGPCPCLIKKNYRAAISQRLRNAAAEHEGSEGEKRYRFNISLLLELDESGWLTSRPGRFTPGKKTRYLLYRGAWGGVAVKTLRY